MRLFLTGIPGVGKTTLIRAVLERLEGITSAGFYTEEIRQSGRRTGFRIVTLDGHAATLASSGKQQPTVGKYSIHVEEFEKLVLRYLDPVTTLVDLYVIDEIGKMELLSDQFRIRISNFSLNRQISLQRSAKKAMALSSRSTRAQPGRAT